MVFLDTNVWIELLAAATPQEDYQIKQAQAASNLLKDIVARDQKIVTCKEQLVELIHAVMKIQMGRFNKSQRKRNLPGVGGLKQFRKSEEFSDAKKICIQAYDSIKKLAMIDDSFFYDIDELLNSLDMADINDIMYCAYCKKHDIKLYTFDKDMNDIDIAGESVIVLA